MDAIVSGSANAALLIDGNGRFSLRRTATGVERVPRSDDLGLIFGDAGDLVFLEDTDEAAVLHELDLARASVRALHLALMLCDPETAIGAARLGGDELEALLARPEVAERVERILDAKPMPAPFKVGIALMWCRKNQLTGATAFFENLAARQLMIAEVRRAWDVLPSSLFVDGEERTFADGLLAREGVFRSLVRALQEEADLREWAAGTVAHFAATRWRVERWLPAWVEGLSALAARRADRFGVPAIRNQQEDDLKALRYPALAERLLKFGGFEELERWRMAEARRSNRVFPMC
jgi:hypothetical protein